MCRIFFFSIWAKGFKLSSCSTQLSLNFLLLINAKMPTIVGIFTLMTSVIEKKTMETSSNNGKTYVALDEQVQVGIN